MGANERREKLINILKASTRPISGSNLAKELGVSRQVIVQDVALLRASDYRIISTNKGYLLFNKHPSKYRRSFIVKHSTQEIEEELCLIVDMGGRVLDVAVSHDLYGDISTNLIINNRMDVYEFVEKLDKGKVMPLKELTDDIHIHNVEADSEEMLDNIERALDKRGILYKKDIV